jgi:choline dehydrogenase
VHDVVIVGAGAAGCVLASRLTEDPDRSVLLLEAGARARRLETRVPVAFSKLFRTSLDWGDSTAPQGQLDGREIVFPRGRALGGSTVLNAMIALRGQRADYDDWAARGCRGWSWDDVEPAFAAAAAGPFPLTDQRDPHVLSEAFVHAVHACGFPLATDLNGETVAGVGLVPVTQRRGRRFGVVDGYLRPALRRPNLTVATGARVTRVLVEDHRAVGVAYRPEGTDEGGEEEALADEVVVSAGTIGSPQLLQLSGIGPRDALERAGVDVVHELPGVGANLLDHLASGLFVGTRNVETLASAQSFRNLLDWAARGRGPLTSNVAEAAALVHSGPAAGAPDLELLFAPVLFVDQGLTQPTEHGFTLGVILLHPRSSGTVSLRSSDPRDPPVVDPRYLTDPEGADAATLLRGLRIARRVVSQAPLAAFVDRELEPGADARTDDELLQHIRALSQTLYHPVGTCRMGADPLAVVDPSLRVRGIDALRVVDASVMPALPSGHTNWPTVMIAERAAALLRHG